MNLARALEVALPEIPARKLADRPPRLDPGTTSKEHIEDGKPVVRIYVPCSGNMYTFPRNYWKLAQLFDGRRSYQEIAEKYSQENGAQYSVDEVREFAADLDANDFWYKTPQEKNILLMKETAEERRKKLKQKSRWADLSDVMFPAFNPDPFLNWIYPLTKFIYTPWFTALTSIAFAVTAGITITHWSEIGRDMEVFYSFSNKTWADVVVLYVLTIFVTAVHEFAHAHACKHYGGRVPAMGFALMYLTPTFYTDTTEGFVHGLPHQRFTIAMAGIWSELIVCSVATPIWWGTPPQTLVHDGAYFIMMLTGLVSLVVNWNPLMKLDGYYMLCEVVGIRDLKEDSTTFVSAWVRKHIWGLPVDVPYVPKTRRLGFAVYSILSGVYCYSVLYIVARFAGNIVRNFSPEWGFVPEIAVALWIFKSRIRLLGNFMKLLYLDKKDRVVEWVTPKRLGIFLAVLVIAGALPLYREHVSGRFLLEPERIAIVRAPVAGIVERVAAQEGESVALGDTLATLENLSLKSEYESTRAHLELANQRARRAALEYADYGEARKDREDWAVRTDQLAEKQKNLQLVSPLSGTVLTPRAMDLRGAFVMAGDEVVEIGDLRLLRARIYISEFEMRKVGLGAPGRIQVDGFVRRWDASIRAIGVEPKEMEKGLSSKEELAGTSPPHFYVVDLLVANPDQALKAGMTGTARVYGERRSLWGYTCEGIRNFVSRKVW
ncbi:MAG TPA: HlyD family efflux transporter periplasmic adaptor subunit [Dongiaceae bacterium]|nr:HlyD family efflux transporter periplasmic adaptor subunit [Dongiaceae bacterium]